MDNNTKNKMNIRHTLFRTILLALATYGIFYFSYKYYLPWPGQNDYAQYYPMYLNPLDFTQADSPFIYRQLSALITYGIYHSGIYYPNEIQFISSDHDQRIFFSTLLSNYIGLLLTAIIVGESVTSLLKKSPLLPSLLAGLLCFTAFFSQKGVITEMTEGWSWFLVAVGFYAYLHRRLWPVIIILFLAILQRETIPVVFGVFAAIDLVTVRKDRLLRAFSFWVLVSSILAFGGYLLTRTIIIPVSEYKGGIQLSPSDWLANLADFMANVLSWNIPQELIFQGLITQNSYLILLCLVLFNTMIRRNLLIPLRESYFVQITSAMLLLYLVSIAIGIGNNMGRLAAILTPIIALYSVNMMATIEQD